jgi:hypothetical protein
MKMWLLSIFRKKKESLADLKKDLSKLINYGILLEDADILLKWNEPIVGLKKNFPIQEKLFADRAEYKLGEHDILNCLKLSLSTVFWYHKEESADKKLRSVSFQAEGNDDSAEYLKLISNHLEQQFKSATSKEISETSTYLEWIVGDVKLSLYFFEKYSVNKLQFEICRL